MITLTIITIIFYTIIFLANNSWELIKDLVGNWKSKVEGGSIDTKIESWAYHHRPLVDHKKKGKEVVMMKECHRYQRTIFPDPQIIVRTGTRVRKMQIPPD